MFSLSIHPCCNTVSKTTQYLEPQSWHRVNSLTWTRLKMTTWAHAKAVAIIACFLGLCCAQISLRPESTVKVLPGDDGQLNSFTFIICAIEPVNISVDTRWVLPSGKIIASDSQESRFLVSQGEVALRNGGTSLSSILLIQNLSYHDAGVYTCEVRSTSICEQDWPTSATVELQLQVNVYIPQNSTTVVAYSNDTEVELSCEMTEFIRSDENLQWFKDNYMIDGTNRYTVTYRNATPNAAQSGGNGKVAGRASVLTITNPSPSDSGSYSCRVKETSAQSADIHLIVIAGPTDQELSNENASTLSSTETPPSQFHAPSPSPMKYPALQNMALSTDCLRVTGIVVGCTFISTAILTAALTVIGMLMLQKYKLARTVKWSERKKANSREVAVN